MFYKHMNPGYYTALAESSLHVKSLAKDEIERDLHRSLLISTQHSMQAIS